MAVNYEAAASVATATFTQTLSTTIVLGGASSSRAVLIGLAFETIGVTGVTVTIGAQSATLISGTDTGSNNTSYRTMLFGLATSLAGTQTITASWTSNSAVAIGAISATGVNQSTPFNNGTFFFQNNPPELNYSLSITSTSGDLTSSMIQAFWNSGTTTTNQTQKWSGSYSSGNNVAADIGPGTGTTTHTWSNASGIASVTISGANFAQMTAASLSSSIAGHATVTGGLKGKGVLASPITGHSAITAVGVGHTSDFSNITGRATVSGNLTGGGALVGRFSKIILSWTAASDPVDGYDVFRGPTPGGEATVPLNSVLILSTSYTDASPLPGNNYYVVKSSLGGVLSQITNEEGILSASSNINGRATITAATIGTGTSPIRSVINGHAPVSGGLKGLGRRTSSITGLATISGNLTAKGVLASPITGAGTVKSSIQNVPIFGKATVTANLKAKGVLASPIAGHATLSAVQHSPSGVVSHITGAATVGATGTATLAKITGKSMVVGLPRATGAFVVAVAGRSTVVANLGSVALQGCFGQAFLIPKLTASALLSAHCSGHCSIGAAIAAPPVPKPATGATSSEIHETFSFTATNPNQVYQTNARTGQTPMFTVNEPDNVNGSSTTIVLESGEYMSVSPPPGLQIIGGLVLDQFGNLTVPVNKGGNISGVVAGGSVISNPA